MTGRLPTFGKYVAQTELAPGVSSLPLGPPQSSVFPLIPSSELGSPGVCGVLPAPVAGDGPSGGHGL